MTAYPLHDEILARQGERLVVQNVLDWLDERGLTICSHEGEARVRFDGIVGGYQPDRRTKDRLIADILGIDFDAFEAEKDQMLADFRTSGTG